MGTLHNIKPVEQAIVAVVGQPQLAEQHKAERWFYDFLVDWCKQTDDNGMLDNNGPRVPGEKFTQDAQYTVGVAKTIAALQRLQDPALRERLIHELDNDGKSEATITVAGKALPMKKSSCFTHDWHLYATGKGVFAGFDPAQFYRDAMEHAPPKSPASPANPSLQSGLRPPDVSARTGVQHQHQHQ